MIIGNTLLKPDLKIIFRLYLNDALISQITRTQNYNASLNLSTT